MTGSDDICGQRRYVLPHVGGRAVSVRLRASDRMADAVQKLLQGGEGPCGRRRQSHLLRQPEEEEQDDGKGIIHYLPVRTCGI